MEMPMKFMMNKDMNQMGMMNMNMDQMGMMDMNMNQMSMMGMNMNMDQMRMIMNMNQMGMMGMNMNQMDIVNRINHIEKLKNEYYIIKHKHPLNEKQLDRSQINLSLFFNGISNFGRIIPKYGEKILINYYDLEKIEIYLDLDLNIKELISIIFGSIFFFCSNLRIYKRTNSNQTTKWITDNPIIYYSDDGLFSNAFVLEYKNKNLNDLSNKTGKEVGLKTGEEILLKLNQNFKEQLISLPLDGSYITIILDKSRIAHFPTFEGEETEEIRKRINFCLPHLFFLSNELLKYKYFGKKIFSGRIIYLVSSNILHGAGVPIDFTDLSKGKIKELKFGKNAPDWRKVQEGLNIFGICCNPKCIAYKKEVVFMPSLFDHKFNLNDNITNIKCPICKTIIKLKTCGFWKCEYQFIGQKIENGILIDFDSKPKETKNNEFEYYDPSENGKATWTKLLIYIIPKQKIKYKSN